MNHKIYQKVLNERLSAEREAQQSDKVRIQVVYTSPNLVKAGQEIMRERRKAQQSSRAHSAGLAPA